jgi:hypothetical protein
MFNHRLLISALISFLFLHLLACPGFLLPALAQDSGLPLPFEAGQALEKGRLAAQQQDWKLAIRYFEEARKASPYAPQVFFNLGLAESKIPGRELRAMAWFKGYLELVPKAANAPQVRNQLTLLEVSAESTMGKIIDQARQMIPKFPDEDSRTSALSRIAVAQIKAGDREGGRQTASSLPRKEVSSIQSIAVALAETGDMKGAQDLVYSLESRSSSSAFKQLAVIQAKTGDIKGAQESLEKISSELEKYHSLMALAEAHFKAGNQSVALQTLLQAKEALKKYRSVTPYFYSKIVEQQLNFGDLKAAIQTASLVDKDYKSQTEGYFNSYYQKNAESRLKAGDWNGAREMADRITEESRKRTILGKISQELYKGLQRKLDQGDEAGARLVVDSIPAKVIRIKALLELRDFSAAQAIAEGITDPKEKADALLTLARGYLVSGDLNRTHEILKSLKPVLTKAKSDTLQDQIDFRIELLVQTNDPAEAKEANKSITSDYYRNSNYGKIARMEAEQRQYAQARQTAALITDLPKKNEAYQKIGEIAIDRGDLERAGEVVALITEKEKKEEILQKMAQWQAAQGFFSQARETADSIADSIAKVKVFREIARYQNRAGYLAGAEETLSRLNTFIERQPDPAAKVQYYDVLAVALRSQPQGAGSSNKILLSCRDWAMKIPDPKTRADSLHQISIRARSNGLFSLARESILLALDSASLMNKSGGRMNDPKITFGELASRQDATGDFAGALQTAYRIEDRGARDFVLARIGREAAEWGDRKSARELIKEIRSRDRQDDVYGALVKRLAGEGDIPEALQVASSIQGTSHQKLAQAAIILAYLKKGDRVTALELASRYKDDPPLDVFEVMTQAGEIVWARQSLRRLTSHFWLERFMAGLAEAQVKAGDLKGGSQSAAAFPSRRACLTLAQAGDKDYARACTENLSENDVREVLLSLALTLSKQGDAPGAKKIISELQAGRLDIDTRRGGLIDVQLALGDSTGAMETLAQLHPKDKEFEPWARHVLALSKANENWKETAAAIKDPFWQSMVYSARAFTEKELAGFKGLIRALPDPGIRSGLVLYRIGQEIKKGSLTDALGLIELIPDPDYKLTALGEINQTALKLGNPSGLIPKLLALPDGPGKAYILLDAVKVLLAKGDNRNAVSLLNPLSKSIALMPEGFGKARAFLDLASVAGKLNDRKQADRAGQQAESLAGRLPETERGLYTRYKQQTVLSGVAGRAATDPEQDKANEQRKEKVEKWVQLLTTDLAKPLFLDLSGTVQSLGTRTKPWDIFSGLTDSVVEMAAMFNKIKAVGKEK